MICRNCQAIIPDDSIFCESCGAPTGLNPDEIAVMNLVPEDAVEFEVSEDVPQAASVPVDPVWWEPPEDTAGEGSWDDWEEPEKPIETAEPQEPEEPAGAQEPFETSEEAELPEPAEREAVSEHHDRPDLRHMAEEAAEQAKPYLRKAKSLLGDLGKNVRTGTGWAADKVKQQFEKREDEPEESELTDEPEESELTDEPEEFGAPGAPAGQDESIVQEAEEPAEGPAEHETPRAPEISVYSDEPEEGEAPAAFEEPELPVQPDVPELSPEPEAPDMELPKDTEPQDTQPRNTELPQDSEEPVDDAQMQAKLYVDKAKSLLGDLGKNVRTGTGWAAEKAKQQLHQKKEEYEERKELREKQKEEERRREEEQRQRDEEARRQQEQERQEELQRQREKEERELEEDLIQRPGFWYGQQDESDFQETLEREPEETGEDLEPAAPETVDAPEESEIFDAPAGPEDEDASAEPKDGEEPVESEPEPEQPEPAPEPAEPLPEQEIEDKLADTARFHWSEEDLKEAAEPGEELPEDRADAAEEDPEDAEAEEETSFYRIRNYEPYDGAPAKPPILTKEKIRLIVVIAIVAAIVASIAGVMIHQAHERQLAEEAYAASVKQAEQLAASEKYEEAEAQYLKLMEQRPEDTQLYVELAEMYIAQQRYVDAKALIKRAIEITGDEESFKQMKADLKVLTSRKWKKEYIKVLEDNESDIRRYEERVQASVAVCDVNGDMKPELFFFTREYYGYGKLHIYTTVDNKAKEVTYECKNRGTQYHDAFYDVSSSDSSYAIFNNKENGRFSIYANIIHGNDSWDSTNEYNLNLNGGCRRENLIEGSIDTTYSEGENDDSKYLQNEEEIDYNKYIDEFRSMLNDSEQVILYNGSGGDQSVWTKVNPDTVMCMSYDDLMVDLRAK
ncbi:MAG: tetratricopeptide repeat protein [Firmicutes bacterium]|nr:tetratricopeptide repeat protein [Bacillota bacterium]